MAARNVNKQCVKYSVTPCVSNRVSNKLKKSAFNLKNFLLKQKYLLNLAKNANIFSVFTTICQKN